MKNLNSLMVFFLVAVMALASSVSATPASGCVDADFGPSVGPNIWVGSYAQDSKDKLVDDCDGSSTNLKEAVCQDDKTHPENIKCDDYGAVCVTVGDKTVGDYCGCPEGSVFDDEEEFCVPKEIPSTPEFGVIAAGLALAGAGGYISYKRRKK